MIGRQKLGRHGFLHSLEGLKSWETLGKTWAETNHKVSGLALTSWGCGGQRGDLLVEVLWFLKFDFCPDENISIVVFRFLK